MGHGLSGGCAGLCRAVRGHVASESGTRDSGEDYRPRPGCRSVTGLGRRPCPSSKGHLTHGPILSASTRGGGQTRLTLCDCGQLQASVSLAAQWLGVEIQDALTLRDPLSLAWERKGISKGAGPRMGSLQLEKGGAGAQPCCGLCGARPTDPAPDSQALPPSLSSPPSPQALPQTYGPCPNLQAHRQGQSPVLFLPAGYMRAGY